MKHNKRKILLYSAIALVSVPVIIWALFATYIEQSEVTIDERILPGGDVFKVTKKLDGGFSGSGYWYTVYHKVGPADKFHTVTGWDRIVKQEYIELYSYRDLLFLLTPNRRDLYVKNKDGNWITIDLTAKFKTEAHTPHVWLEQFDVHSGNFVAILQTDPSKPKQIATFSVADDGKNVNVISIQNAFHH